MNLRVPRGGLIALAAFAALAIFVLLLLTARFGGPAIRLSQPFELRGSFPDTQGIAVRSDVLVRGVAVGRVAKVERRGDRAVLTLALDDSAPPVRRSATARIGTKTLLGEAYVDLDPGAAPAPELHAGQSLARDQVLPSVEIDEALGALTGSARGDMRSLLRDAGAGATDPATPERVSSTVAELRRTTAGLLRLGDELRGQRRDIAGAVENSRQVVGELGNREASVRTLVSSGRRVLAAVAAQKPALRAGIEEAPRLLGTATRALREADPLLHEARPLAADLRRASPPLAAALRALPSAAADTDRLLAAVPRFQRATRPLIRQALPALRELKPVARRLGPALANLVPVVRYLSARRKTVAAWFSNTADLGLNGDKKGSWARFFISFEPTTAFGTPGGNFANNTYTRPNDAADNQPYRPGDYPELRPFKSP